VTSHGGEAVRRLSIDRESRRMPWWGGGALTYDTYAREVLSPLLLPI